MTDEDVEETAEGDLTDQVAAKVGVKAAKSGGAKAPGAKEGGGGGAFGRLAEKLVEKLIDKGVDYLFDKDKDDKKESGAPAPPGQVVTGAPSTSANKSFTVSVDTIRSNAKYWQEQGAQLGRIGSKIAGMKLSNNKIEAGLFAPIVDAYNRLVMVMRERCTEGVAEFTAMGGALTKAADNYQAADTDGAQSISGSANSTTTSTNAGANSTSTNTTSTNTVPTVQNQTLPTVQNQNGPQVSQVNPVGQNAGGTPGLQVSPQLPTSPQNGMPTVQNSGIFQPTGTAGGGDGRVTIAIGDFDNDGDNEIKVDLPQNQLNHDVKIKVDAKIGNEEVKGTVEIDAP